MHVSELPRLHKQCGAKFIAFHEGKIQGYAIKTYKGIYPETVELEKTADNPTDTPVSWDGAYDRLYGFPDAPDFIKVLA